ncbi:MAG: carboxymuconolactone decarboxylase family protein [Spongiibacteraceae bacterium]|nr:carboxymuconolactone decarboxylase family protein [Spongiibacteraceae bacterium]
MPNENKPRIKPLLPPDWNQEIIDALGAFPGGLKFVQSGWEKEGQAVRGTYMLGSFAHHPDLAKAFLTFNNHVATNSTLSARDRELIILRTGWLRQCEYEYVMHVILGSRAGLSDEEITRTQQGPDAPGWNKEDADLIRVADELHTISRISEKTWTRLASRYSQQQMLDMIFLVGCYDMVAISINSLGVSLEPGVDPLDAKTKARMNKQIPKNQL